MKIDLIISSLSSGGAERVVSLLANEFVNRGHEVRLLTFSPNIDAYELDSRIERIKYEKKYLVFNFTSVKCFFFLFFFYLKKKNRPDIISSHMTLIGYATIPISKLFAIKSVVSEHTNHINSGRFIGNKILWRYFYPLADAVTVLTNFDLPFFRKFNKNTVVLTNPCSFTPLSENQKIGSREKLILAVGSLNRYHEKGLDNLIDIAKYVLPQNPSWKLKIIGHGEAGMEYLNNKVDEFDLENQIEFTGFRSDIKNLMKQAEIFVLSSRFEGLPMALLEAMSQKMICVSYNCISGPSEIITNNFNGILVKNQDKEAMADQLNMILRDKVLRRKLRNNIDSSLSKFSLYEVANEWEKLFKKLF